MSVDIFEILWNHYQFASPKMRMKIESIVNTLQEINYDGHLHFSIPYESLQLSIDDEMIISDSMIVDFCKNSYPNKFKFGSSLKDKLKDIYQYVDLFFPGCEKENDQGLYINIFMDESECLSFLFAYDHEYGLICYIAKLGKTSSLSGSQILRSLELLLKAYADDVDYIELCDVSRIELDTKNVIPLSYVFIFVKGHSWYNSLGFYQKNYEKEKESWSMIRNKSFVEFLEDCEFQVKIDRKLELKQFIYHSTILKSLFSEDMPISDIFTTVYLCFKNNIRIDESIVDSYIYLLSVLSKILVKYSNPLFKKRRSLY